MAASKPIILMAHGAWHLPQMYDSLKKELNALGYTFLCPELKTVGADKHGVTWQADKELLLSLVEPLFEQGKEIVIIGHSYGGIPACAATEGNGVQERAAAGKKGGFRCIVYLAGFAIPQRGLTLLEVFGGQWAPWHDAAIPNTKNQLIRVNEKAKEALFNGFPEAEQAAYLAKLVPHSQDALETPVDFVVADITIPKTYIVCELDQALPASLQEKLVETVPGFQAERIGAGHSPFLSNPKECAELIAKISEGDGEDHSRRIMSVSPWIKLRGLAHNLWSLATQRGKIIRVP
ncbi:Alpha/beta hydrolase fold-1 [Apiospora arundinis]|uniref:Alpha/beta hydrolase fold-1 n=1 Tax=Apiospora arundinis TaxID=335852 RepID=A0ABR2JN74_9PEZI